MLQKEMSGLRGFSETGIRRMRIFYEEWIDVLFHPTTLDEICQSKLDKLEDTALQINSTLLDELQVNENLLLNTSSRDTLWNDFLNISFSHHIEIITRAKTIEARLFYIHMTAIHSWTLATLKNFCKQNLYENRGTMPSNFLQALPDAQLAAKAVMAFKDEYLLDMVNVENVGEKEEDWDEQVIESQIVGNMRDFILRFGVDFIFVDSQHYLTIEGEQMKADLIFFQP